MSLYLRTLSKEDQDTLRRPDIPPSIHPNWQPETSPEKEGEHTCVISNNPTPGNIDWDQQAPRIHRRDVEDLRKLWLNSSDDQPDIKSPLRGYWKIDNWERTRTECIVILQYKTLRVCIRGGSGPVVIGTADIDNILYLVMDWFTGDEVPQCVGNVLFNNHMLQWLLLPVERYGDAGLEAYIQYFRGGEGRGPEEDHMVAMEKILAELGYRFENVDTRGAEAVMRKHRINSQDVKNLNAAYKAASLPTGYETLNTWGLEELIMADAAKSAGESDDPYPLPLTIDQPQAEQILELQDDTMELVKQREYPDFEKEELKSLIWKLADPKIQEGLSSAVSRYSDLLKENEQAEFQEHWGEQHPGQDASSGASRYHLPSHLWGGQSGSGTLSRSTLGHALSVQQANDISGWTHQPPPSAVYPSGHRRQYYGHYNTNEDDGGEPSGGYYEASLPEESFLSGADFCEDEYEHGGYYNTGHGEGGSSRQRYSWQ